jgi:hypothetical protein
VRRTVRLFPALLLIVAGIAGLLVSVFDLVGLDFFTKDPALIGLLMVSLISTGLGIERATTLRGIQSTMGAIGDHLNRSAKTKRLEGTDAIYKDGARLVGQAESQIRSVLVGEGMKAPRFFAMAAAKRLQELMKAGKPASMTVILVLPKNAIPANFRELVLERHELYRKKGVGELVSVYVIEQDQAIGMDYLIVDRQHVAISFTPAGQTHTLMSSIVVEDQPELAVHFADWFDNKLLRAARHIV